MSWSVGDRITSDLGRKSAIIHTASTSTSYEISDIIGTLSGTITNGTNEAEFVSIDPTFTDNTTTVLARSADPPHTIARTSSASRFTRRRYEVRTYEGSSDTDVLSQDSTVVFGTQEGVDGLTTILTNPNVCLLYTSDAADE